MRVPKLVWFWFTFRSREPDQMRQFLITLVKLVHDLALLDGTTAEFDVGDPEATMHR